MEAVRHILNFLFVAGLIFEVVAIVHFFQNKQLRALLEANFGILILIFATVYIALL